MVMSIARRLAVVFPLALAAAACGGESFDDETAESDEVGEVALAIKLGGKFRHNLGEINGIAGLLCADEANQAQEDIQVGNCSVEWDAVFCRPQFVSGEYSCVCDGIVTGLEGSGCGGVTTAQLF